jgi:hypothetical protein
VIPNSMADSVTTVHLQKLAQFLVDLDWFWNRFIQVGEKMVLL